MFGAAPGAFRAKTRSAPAIPLFGASSAAKSLAWRRLGSDRTSAAAGRRTLLEKCSVALGVTAACGSIGQFAIVPSAFV